MIEGEKPWVGKSSTLNLAQNNWISLRDAGLKWPIGPYVHLQISWVGVIRFFWNRHHSKDNQTGLSNGTGFKKIGSLLLKIFEGELGGQHRKWGCLHDLANWALCSASNILSRSDPIFLKPAPFERQPDRTFQWYRFQKNRVTTAQDIWRWIWRRKHTTAHIGVHAILLATLPSPFAPPQVPLAETNH